MYLIKTCKSFWWLKSELFRALKDFPTVKMASSQDLTGKGSFEKQTLFFIRTKRACLTCLGHRRLIAGNDFHETTWDLDYFRLQVPIWKKILCRILRMFSYVWHSQPLLSGVTIAQYYKTIQETTGTLKTLAVALKTTRPPTIFRLWYSDCVLFMSKLNTHVKVEIQKIPNVNFPQGKSIRVRFQTYFSFNGKLFPIKW